MFERSKNFAMGGGLALLLIPTSAQKLEDLKPYVSLNSQGTLIAIMKETTIAILDADSGQILNELNGFDKIYPPLEWSESGTDIAFVHNGDIEIWRTVAIPNQAIKSHSIKYYEPFDLNNPPYVTIHGIAWISNDNQMILGIEGAILLWDIQNNNLLDQYLSDGWRIARISTAFEPLNEDEMSIGDAQGVIRLLSFNSKTEIIRFTVPVHTSYNPYIESLAVSHSKNSIVLAEGVGNGSVGAIYRWDFSESTEFYNNAPPIYTGHNGQPVYALAWSPDDRLIASIGADYTIQIWDAATGQTHEVIQIAPDTPLLSIAWSSDGSEVFYVDRSGVLHREDAPALE